MWAARTRRSKISTTFLNLNPENADAYCGRAAAYLKKDDPQQAIVELNEAIRLAV